MNAEQVKTWFKRIEAAKDAHNEWDKKFRVQECYNYWLGFQRAEEFDEFGFRRAQINKVHPEVRNSIPSLYYYRPYIRLNAAPESLDDPGTQVESDTQLLQDTVNHLVRDPSTMYRESTYLALKESFWSIGCVEVGYTAEFNDAPNVRTKPPLKEKKSTKVDKAPAGEQPDDDEESPEPGMDDMGLSVDEDSDLDSMMAEVDRLRSEISREVFFVKHIPSKQLLVSISDKPILDANDWVGYWEDVPVEDVKRSGAYKIKGELKPNCGNDERSDKAYNEAVGDTDKVRLYKIWDIRTHTKYVFAEGHDSELLAKPFKRHALKFLRFDVIPYHFYPRPVLFSKLGPQDEYNDSREYLRKIRLGTVPRYTYDEDAIEATQLKKLESGEMGTYVPRKGGTSNVFEAVQQPNYSENAIQTLTLSDKEFADVGGVGGDARIASTKTATQAKIAETKDQVQDSFDRQIVADFLADVARELLALAIDHMNLDQWIAINVVPDGLMNAQVASNVAQSFQRINAEILSDAAAGVRWDVIIDLESLSPVSEEEKFQKWMQGLSLFANPPMARLFAASPELLFRTLSLLGVKSSRDQQLMAEAMLKVVQMEAQLAAQSQNAAPGISPQAGSESPGAPSSGGPQPGGPAGPGASVPKPPSA